MLPETPHTPAAGPRSATRQPWWVRFIVWLLAPAFASPPEPDPVDPEADAHAARPDRDGLSPQTSRCLDAAQERAVQLGVGTGVSLWASALLAHPGVVSALAEVGVDAAAVARILEAATHTRRLADTEGRFTPELAALLDWASPLDDGTVQLSPLGALCLVGLADLEGDVGTSEARATAKVLRDAVPLARLLAPAWGWAPEPAGGGVLRVHNDDVTTFDCVMRVLMHVVQLHSGHAAQVAMAVHHTGHADLVGIPLEEAQRMAQEAMALAAQEGFQLRLSAHAVVTSAVG